MMVPKTSLFLAGLALLSMGAVSSAQSNGKALRKVTKPLRTATLDLNTGTVTRGPSVKQRGASTVCSLTNLDFSGFVGVDTGSCACEWFSAGVKAGGATEYMNQFCFAYCSAAADLNSGGSGGAAQIGFSEGYTLGGTGAGPGSSPNGTAVAIFCLTGLPANTASSSFFGGFNCFLLNVTVAGDMVCFADGAIGWSWKFKDLGADGVLAATFPFLGCVTTCSGPGPDAQGMTDMVDQYCPPGTLLTTFTFTTNTLLTTYTSINMKVKEAGLASASSFTYNGLGCNPITFTNITQAVINSTWSTSLDCTGNSPGFAALVAQDAPSGGIKIGAGEILVDIFFGNNLLYCLTVHAGGPVTFDKDIPKQFQFICFPAWAQGVCLGAPGAVASNGIGIVTGTF